jgi:hypothetical protein
MNKTPDFEIPENIIGERRDIAEKIIATDQLSEEDRAQILAMKDKILATPSPSSKTVDQAEEKITSPDKSDTANQDFILPGLPATEGTPASSFNLSGLAETEPTIKDMKADMLATTALGRDSLATVEIPLEKEAPSSVREMLAEDIGLVIKKEEVVAPEKDPQDESIEAIADLEAKLNSADYSDEEKGKFEEDRDALKKEAAQKAELDKIGEAVKDVASGKSAEATVEVSADAFSEYGAALRAQLAYTSGRYGEEKQTKKLEKELAAFEKKEASVLQVRESSEFAKQKLEDPNLDPAVRAKLEKNKATLEAIAQKLEAKRQSQDRGFKEKSLDWAKENIAERWRKGKWYNKVAAGAALSMLTLGASQFVTRPLGLYASYQGIKQGKLSKLTNQIQDLEASGKSDEAQMAEIEKTIIENSYDKKSLLGALGLAVGFGALGEYISSTGVLEPVTNYVGDKLAEGVNFVEGIISGEPGAVVQGAAGVAGEAAAVGAAAAALENAAPEGAIFEHTSVTVESGDTMYSILEDEFNISDKLTEEGRQYNAIENILAQIKANPAEYGIVSGDVNNLNVGDKINIEKIADIVANHKIAGQGIFEHAQGLPPAVVTGIENYMPSVAKAVFSEAAKQKVELAASAVIVPPAVGSSVSIGSTSSVVAGAPLTGEVTLGELKAEGSTVDSLPQAAAAPIEAPVIAPEPVVPPRVEVGLITASLNMSDVEAARTNSLVFTDFARFGGDRADVVRFGAEPISRFLQNPPAGSEKMMALVQNYNGRFPIGQNEPGTVLQYLQRAALGTVRNSNLA